VYGSNKGSGMDHETAILLVDDDPDLLQLFSEILRGEGYQAWEARTGAEGLDLARAKRPELVLLDVVLPDLSGVEICRQIKADPALSDVAVALFSGRATSTADKVDGLEAGADDYIARPVAPHEFLARVRTILRLRHTTAALRASDKHYRQLVEILPEAVVLLDLQGRLVEFNPQGVAMLGYAVPSELLGKSAFDLTLPEDHERVRADIATTLASGTLPKTEYTLIGKDGRHFPAELSAAVFRDLHDQPAGLVLVATDISERYRTEEQIRLLVDAIQSTTELISVTDRENRFTFVNRAFLEAYGYAWEEILGKTPHLLYSPKNPPGMCERVFQQTFEGGWKGEILNRAKDGREFPIWLSTSQIQGDRGGIIGLVGVARDISDWKRGEQTRAALSQLGYRLSTALAPDQAARIIFEVASDLLDWDAGYVALYSQAEDRITPVLTFDTVGGKKTPFPSDGPSSPPTPFMRRVIEGGAQLVNEAERPRGSEAFVPFGDSSRRSASRMFVPIHYGSAVMGLLSLQSYQPQAYTPQHLELLQALANYCAGALRRIELTEALRQAEAKYRNIFENATEGIFQTTPEGRFLSANPALARMIGYPTPDALIAGVTDVEHQLYVKPERRHEFQRMMQEQGTVRGFELEHYRKDRSTIWVSINAHAVREGDSGRVLFYEGTIQDITKAKRAEEALQMSQVLQRAMLDNIPDPAWLKDEEGRFLACNEPLAKVYGRPRDQILGRTVFDLIPQEAARLAREDAEVLRSGRPAVTEAPLTPPQGQERWFETIRSPLLDERGHAIGTVGISREITERRWAQNVLKAQCDFGLFLSATSDLNATADRLLQLALETEAVDCGAVYLVDPKTGAMDLVRARGLSADFARNAAHVAAHPDEAPRSSPRPPERPRIPLVEIVRLLRSEGLQALELIPLQHGGIIVAVLAVGSRVQREIPLRSRQVIEAIATQTAGALARVRAEEAARTQRQLLEKTLESLYAAVFIVDARAATIQECNSGATRMFGYGREDFVGQSAAMLHRDRAAQEEFQRHLQAAIAGKGLAREFEFTMRRRDGSAFPTEQHLAPIRDEAGKVTAWVSIIRDITKRKRNEEELREASRRIIEAQEAERLRVARDLHDGVNQLIASAKMRLRKVRDMAAGLGPAGREILDRCDGLLVQALEENRRIAHDLRPSDLDALGLAAACRSLCSELRSRTSMAVECSLTRRAESLPPPVRLNLFRIVQEAFTNIERHAHAKTVRLRLSLQGNSLVLRIQDDGRGFEVRQANPARAKRRGIGLTNIRERAASLGGACQIESAPGQGTTLTVRVPCDKPA